MPTLIKWNGEQARVAGDAFTRLADDQDIPGGDVIISMTRFQAEGETLLGEGRRVGVEVVPSEAVEALAYDLPRIAVVALKFPKFRDGRGYSAARILRERLGYSGEIRAVGDVLLEQAGFMVRCGIDAFEPADGTSAEDWTAATRRFRHVYQRAADDRVPAFEQRGGDTAVLDRVVRPNVLAPSLDAGLRDATPQAILKTAIDMFADRLALVSSFGAESAVLLHMLSRINPDVPVLFLDTGMLFGQTLDYRQQLATRLGLTDVRNLRPRYEDLATNDPGTDLWKRDIDGCCHIRKVKPLDAALGGFDAWVTGRKRFHGGDRLRVPVVETTELHTKFNPLANWDKAALDAYAALHDLPAHPLVAQGYPSVGCWPCTSPVDAGGDVRAGRWVGSQKTECGIHTARAPGIATFMGSDI